MRLSELLSYQDIVIQCHDNPDADALASGSALVWFFQKMGKTARFIYRGRNSITKSNLKIMLETLHIPVSYEPDLNEVPDLLITVDCQYGERNVTTTQAPHIATIDHHQVSGQIPQLSEIRSNLASCATVVWNLLREEGLDPDTDKYLSTALYYGLFTDSNRLSEISHPLDRDMLEALPSVQRSIINRMCNANISLSELMISGKAILNCQFFEDQRYMILQSEPCDPNILGVISDFALETDGVDVCLAFYTNSYEVKFSVRSCIKEVHANELAAFLAEGYGGGGGHILKAGGSLRPEKLSVAPFDLLSSRMADYLSMFEILYAKDITLDTSNMKVYEKLPQEVGTLRLADLFEPKSKVEVRTMEGDIIVTVEEDLYLMIGIEGEVYPTNRKKLLNSYQFLDRPYSRKFEYSPNVKDLASGERKFVMEHAQAVISNGGGRIYARPLERSTKLFTAWDEEKYYLGHPGDYIAVRAEDEHDIYLINSRLFPMLYKEADDISRR